MRVHELSSRSPRTQPEADGTLLAAFEEAVLLHHHRPALGASRWQPTYGELNAAANRLAHALLRDSGTSEDRVAILMQHDTPVIAAILAVLKAGKIAAVLNPTHPPARLRQLMEDIEPALIVTDIVYVDLASDIAGPACSVLRFEDESGHGPDHNPALVIGADQTACLVYTSGSTGRPKGVMKTHRQLIHGASIQTDAMGYTAHDCIPLLASLGSGQGLSKLRSTSRRLQFSGVLPRRSTTTSHFRWCMRCGCLQNRPHRMISSYFKSIFRIDACSFTHSPLPKPP
jgi:acyl-CoA synthetase (AMP-forming)/AMP-acid ligase II